MGELCNLAKLIAVTGAYPVHVFNVGWVGLVCVGVQADDGWAGLVVRVAQSVSHHLNPNEDGFRVYCHSSGNLWGKV